MSRTRIILADDHDLMLVGIRALLEPIHDVVGTACDGRSLVEMALRLKPDVVVLDISMPLLNGLEAAQQIKQALPSTKLIFLSMHGNPLYLRKALDAGASGYVLKSGAAEELLTAISEAERGGIFLTPGFGHEVMESLLTATGRASRPVGLTHRQREILQLLAEGRPNKEIAHIIGISIKTVEFHRGRIMARLGAHSAAEVTRIAMQEGLIVS